MPSTPRSRLRPAPLPASGLRATPLEAWQAGHLPAENGAMPLGGGTVPRPPYARVKQYLKDALEAGRWAPGEQMPSEADLVAQFGVSRMTVHRALRELQDVGLITRLQGVGTFAAQLNRVSSTLTINDIQEEIH